jgi:LuxR family maltose regulon positive regulatory protein
VAVIVETDDNLRRALETALRERGMTVAVASTIARDVVARFGRPEPRAREPLTRREREILSLLVAAHAYASVAARLAISLSTVQSHVKSIYRKLGVCSKAEAVNVALTEQLLSSRPLG